MAKIVNDSLIPSKLNAPLDFRTEVPTLADIPKIENPCPSLKIWVKETGKFYKIKSFKEVAIEGTEYTKKVINEYEEDLDEAPSDGNSYVRQNKKWVKGIQEAPNDGLQYVRKNGEWAKIDTGSTYETVMVTISPNDEALRGAVVTIRDESDGKVLLEEEWAGTLLTCQVGDGVVYTVSVNDIDGYVSPVSVTNKAVRGAVRDIPMKYTLSTLKVNIASNQDSDEIISAVKATVSYGSVTREVSSGETITIPLNIKVVVTFPEVEGYRTPNRIEFTHTNGADVKNVSYDTEALTVTVMTDFLSDSAEGQTVTINGVEYTYQGTPISIKIPYGTEYSIVSNKKYGYTTPPTQKAVASRPSRNVSMIYEKILVGIWIEDTDGRLHSPDDWDGSKVHNSIVYISDEKSLRIGAPKEAFEKKQINSSPNVSPDDVWGESPKYDGSQSGEVFVNEMIDKFPDYPWELARYCKSFVWPNGDIGGWLWNLDEANLIVKNPKINDILEQLGCKTIEYTQYWLAGTMTNGSNQNWMWLGAYVSMDAESVYNSNGHGGTATLSVWLVREYEK